jgi:uncharacterized protein DUF3800
MSYSTHTLYCDETGSTGSRFLDPAQPTFAEGGWFIAHEHQQGATDAIIEIEGRYKSGAAELKGASLVKTARGQSMMREVCETLGKLWAVPYIYVVEKRYAVCSKIVETFFDPLYNPRIPNSDTWDPPKRQAEAQFFYDNGGSLIEDFAEAFRLMDATAVKRNAENWVAHLNAASFHEQADKVAGVLPQIEDEIRTEGRHTRADGNPSGIDSLNLPIVAEVFQFVEQHCPFPCDIVHDQNASFESIYRYFFELFTNAKPTVLEMKDGRRMHYGFRNALSLSFADSKAEPLIRAADYELAGARKFIQLAIEGKPIPVDVTWIAFGSLGSILLKAYTHMHPSLEPMPDLSGYMASNQWTQKVFGRLHIELK